MCPCCNPKVKKEMATDTERLEWLLKNRVFEAASGFIAFNGPKGVFFKTPREAIDAAMKGEK